MKLFYITRVDISSNAAQSVQIDAMCQEFNNQINEFKLISSSPVNIKSTNYKWNNVKFKSKFRYLEFVIKSYQIVKKEKPTHIFTRDIVVAFTLSCLNIKVTYEAHKEPRTFIANLMIKYLKNKSNFLLVTISNSLKNYYEKVHGFKPSYVLDAHDGVFLEAYDKIRDISKAQLRDELNLSKDKTIVMHTGSLHKGDDAKLFKTIVENFKEILFVQVGGYEKDIIRYKEYYNSFDNILFVPHKEHTEIIKYQMSADILFYALSNSNKLWWCTSPLKIFEYMATDIPILASNIGSVAEIINKNNAIIYNPNDKQSIINAMNYYLNNNDNAKYKAKLAVKDVQTYFTWNYRVEKILEFIK